MKFKYLNPLNCKKLIPRTFDIRYLRLLEQFLDQINTAEETRGLVDKLIKQNERTFEKHIKNRIIGLGADIRFSIDLVNKQNELILTEGLAKRQLEGGFSHHTRLIAQIYFSNETLASTNIPLQPLLKGWGDANDGYQCYCHRIIYRAYDENDAQREFAYAGVTSRNWLIRFHEHLKDSIKGSQGLFHKAWKDSLDQQDSLAPQKMVYLSELLMLNVSKDEAMDWEERFVDNHTLTPKGLNMIPGGYKGMKYLHKLRLTDREDISVEERDRAVTEYVRQNPRKGMPNPFMSELWEDDDFYLRVINAKEKTLNSEQVKKIRKLYEDGYEARDIAKQVGALNELQVKKVILGRTYKRIH